MNLTDKLAETSIKQPSLRRRVLAKALPVLVFTIFFPAILFIIPKFYLDRWIHIPSFFPPILRAILSGSLIILGLFFILWAIRAQREIGKGTPMPLMATQNLVIEKPYLYSRNPIYFGVINLFFGISVLFDSISSLIMVLIFSATILIFTKFVEEKELEKRFGEEYLAYKDKTPFLIPSPLALRRKK